MENVSVPLIEEKMRYPHDARLAIPIFGYVCPFLVFITIVFNTLVVIVLLKKHMRTATNMLLTAMAIADMLTGVAPLPWWIFYFSLKNTEYPVGLAWCKYYYYMGEFVPVIFHTASIWLTMALAIQRYIFVCQSSYAKSWCSMERVKWSIFLIFLVSLLYNLPRFFESDYYLKDTVWPNTNTNSSTINQTMVSHCHYSYNYWLQITIGLNIYYNMYFWFRVIFVHAIPCTILVVLNALLLLAMKQAQKRRKKLLQENKKNESKKLRDSNCTTAMLIVVVSVFLVVELPLAVVLIVHIIANTFSIEIVSNDVLNLVTLVTAFLIILSYPVNFCIYCGMSKQFRNTFKNLFIKESTIRNQSLNSTRPACKPQIDHEQSPILKKPTPFPKLDTEAAIDGDSSTDPLTSKGSSLTYL